MNKEEIENEAKVIQDEIHECEMKVRNARLLYKKAKSEMMRMKANLQEVDEEQSLEKSKLNHKLYELRILHNHLED